MPIINGKRVKARYTSLKLNEVSSVDNPAQPGAIGSVIKRFFPGDRAEIAAEIAKYISTDDGAHSFAEVITENKFSEQIWPYTDALSQSIRSIVGDTGLSGADREAKINTSVSEFLAAVRTISPATEKQLSELICKREDPMAKTVEQLEQEIATLKGTHTASIETITKRAEVAEKAAADAVAENLKLKGECDEAKKALVAATDEVITVGGQELRKSAVGEANFSVAKAMREERDTAVFEKRADSEFSHVVGSTTEKALVLKAIDALPEETKKAAEAVFTAAEKMAKAGFETLGSRGGFGQEPTQKAATATFDGKVTEIAKRDGIPEFEAMSKARSEFPTEFAAAYPDAN